MIIEDLYCEKCFHTTSFTTLPKDSFIYYDKCGNCGCGRNNVSLVESAKFGEDWLD